MSHFILIHGAWHDAHVWERVVPELTRRGHSCETPELPGNGIDTTPAGAVTLERYGAAIGARVAAATEPVVLVGHSMAGIILSELGERMPERIAALAYLAAFMLPDGHSILRFYAEHGDPAQKGARAALRMSEDRTYSTIDAAQAPDLFFNTCTPEDAAAAAARLGPMPAQPRADTVHVTPGRWGRLPRHYGRTLRDQTVFPDLQQKMLSLSPGAEVETFDTDHSPFLCAPAAVADWLDRIAAHPGRAA